MSAVQDTKWYKIGEVARKLDIAVETIRMYEREGIFISEKTDTGRRVFNDLDMRWLNCIRRLITEQGLNIEGIRRMLDPGFKDGLIELLTNYVHETEETDPTSAAIAVSLLFVLQSERGLAEIPFFRQIFVEAVQHHPPVRFSSE